MYTVRRGVLLTVVVLLILLVAAGAAFGKGQTPTKVVIITMDQMKPWYAQTFDMKNILWLENNGAYFKRATVGQMASETVVSHNTIVSGQLPKHMGWSDEVMRDAGNVLGYDKDAIITVGDLGYAQYAALIDAKGYPKLGDYMDKAFPGTITANFGGKAYQVTSTAASSSDMYVTIGSKGTVDSAWGLPWTGSYRGPTGLNMPTYISGDHRFKISTGNHAPAGNDYYNTNVDKPAYLYSEDGRMVPGPYDTNLGGDNWVADCAIKVIENGSDWSAMHLNFSGIDKIGHMWGGGNVDTIANYDWDPAIADGAGPHAVDRQERRRPGRPRHAGTQGQRRLGQAPSSWCSPTTAPRMPRTRTMSTSRSGANLSWYYDPNNQCKNTTYGRAGSNNDVPPRSSERDRQPRVQLPVHRHRGVAHRLQLGQEDGEAQAMKGMPDVIATYVKWGDRYKLVSTGSDDVGPSASGGPRTASSSSTPWRPTRRPTSCGLLKDRTSYGAYGDHGGAQKEVQQHPDGLLREGHEGHQERRPVPSGGRAADGPARHGHRADGSDGRHGVQAADRRRPGPCE